MNKQFDFHTGNLQLKRLPRLWVAALLVLAGLLLSACAPLEAWVTIDSVEGGPAEPVLAVEWAAGAPQSQPENLLVWQGALEDGSCGQLVVDVAGAGQVGPCYPAEAEGTAEWLPIHATEWAEIVDHFGALDYLWGDESFQLRGQGDVVDSAGSAVWAEALGRWARFVYLESESGRSGSAARTAVAWQLPAEVLAGAGDTAPGTDAGSDSCVRLTVTRYGYAYVALEPCAGGASELLAQGWLATEEMTELADWLRTWTPLYVTAGYVDGQGDTPAGEAEGETVTAWAEAVVTRLLGE